MDEFVAGLWQQAAFGLIAYFRSAPAFEAHITRTGARVLSGEQSYWFNWTFVEPGEAAADTVRDHATALAARQLPGLIIVPQSTAAALAPLAGELGLVDAGGAPWMVCRPTRQAHATTGVTVERVNDPDTLRGAVALVGEAFDVPLDVISGVTPPLALADAALDIYAVRHDGRVVGTGLCTYGGSVAGIWAMATSAQHQRKGAGRAILEHAIDTAVARGATTLFLAASDAGKHLYESVGFRTVLESRVWLAGLNGAPAAH